MTKLAIFRPEPSASATLARAKELGLEVISIPLFETVPVDWEVPDADDFDGILLTSANTLRLAGPGISKLNALPAFCVGPATAQAAREAGFTIARTGAEGVAKLLRALKPGKRLLHLCGQDRAVPPAKQMIVPVPVYRARIRKPVEGLNQLEGAVAVIHSPRAGQRLSELAEDGHFDRSKVAIAAISPAAMRAAGKGWRATRFASEPRDRTLLALAAELCDKLKGE